MAGFRRLSKDLSDFEKDGFCTKFLRLIQHARKRSGHQGHVMSRLLLQAYGLIREETNERGAKSCLDRGDGQRD